MSVETQVFSPREVISPRQLSEQLAATGRPCRVRGRALGFLVTFEADGAMGGFEIRTLRATDLVRALGPRLSGAPAPLQRALRATEVAYIVPGGLDPAWRDAVVSALVRLGDGVVHDVAGWRDVDDGGG